MFQHYRAGFRDALAGREADPRDDPTRQIRGDCSPLSHYFRGHRDGQKHRQDLLIHPITPMPQVAGATRSAQTRSPTQ